MTVKQQLAELLAELRDVRALLENRDAPAAQTIEHPDDRVGVEEAARRLGLSVRTVREGKAGTGAIPRQSSRPILFLRRDVDLFIRERAVKKRTPKERTLRLLDRSKSRHRSVA